VTDIVGGTDFWGLWRTAVDRDPSRPFLVHLACGGERSEFTYGQFDQLVGQAVNVLHDRGVRLGDRVLLHVGNRPEFLTALMGVFALGAVAAPVHPASTSAELGRVYRSSGARWALVEADRVRDHMAAASAQATREIGLWAVGTASGETPAGVEDWGVACAAQPVVPVHLPAADSDRLAELLYTSGTTAAPKGVMVTHANLVFSGHYGVWQTSLRADDTVVTSMPACHSTFQLGALTAIVAAGCRLVLVQKYSASRFWGQVRAEGGTVVQLIAMMVRTLLTRPPSPEDADHRVREALSFMPLSDTERRAFEERFGVRLTNSYGSTESIGWSVTDPPTGERRWPAVGRAGLGYEVGIFDSDGRELPPGETGEFRIKGTRGRSLMAGYWEDPAATAAALDGDGWLRTHDQGYRDADGWFYFVDRSVNLIKRSGENISATEVECVLTSHPLIAEAAVIGIHDSVRDQAVKAFVRLIPGATLTEADIQDHCRARLAEFKTPSVVQLVRDFPRTPSMKIEKRSLRA
jgi:crotonobetaine/carnitine-CoA ligase